MKLETIFARNDDPAQGGVLAAIYGDGSELNAWDELLKRLNDAEYLHEFFSDREKLLHQQKNEIDTVETAIVRAQDEISDMGDFMDGLAVGKNHDDTYDRLRELFKPLNNQLYRHVDLAKEKARGRKHNRWLRVYAVRVTPNLYIITGGAIKIWHLMEQDETTRTELNKLNRMIDWLKDEGIIDATSFEGSEGL